MTKYKRKEIIGDCILYLGNALEIIPTLPLVDTVVTDPPYKLVSGGNKTGEMGGCFSREVYDNSGSIVKCELGWSDFLLPLYDCMKESTHAYVMANNRNVQPMLNEAEKAGFRFHNLLVWDKGTCTPNRWYMKNLEFTGFFFKGKAKYINDMGSKQLIQIPNPRNKVHPTEKPVELMEHYITNSTNEGEVVLDPFMGSGSTGVACTKTGRKFIGIELDEDYFNIACERIKSKPKEGEK